eukprot:522011_1
MCINLFLRQEMFFRSCRYVQNIIIQLYYLIVNGVYGIYRNYSHMQLDLVTTIKTLFNQAQYTKHKDIAYGNVTIQGIKPCRFMWNFTIVCFRVSLYVGIEPYQKTKYMQRCNRSKYNTYLLPGFQSTYIIGRDWCCWLTFDYLSMGLDNDILNDNGKCVGCKIYVKLNFV